MSNYTVITLTADEMQKCIEFSEKSAETQQDIEFGQKDTKPRPTKEIARDNLIGKMAEAAVSRMLREKYGIKCPVNYEIYPRGEWDDCDVKIGEWCIDIKSTRIGRWLLFETNKLNMRLNQKTGTLDALIMCRTPWDMDKDKPAGTVELVGLISINKLLSADPSVLHLKKGDFIPNTKSKLQADNLAVAFDDLEHDWDKLIAYMKKNPPKKVKG